jgi:hypothetical protein
LCAGFVAIAVPVHIDVAVLAAPTQPMHPRTLGSAVGRGDCGAARQPPRRAALRGTSRSLRRERAGGSRCRPREFRLLTLRRSPTRGARRRRRSEVPEGPSISSRRWNVPGPRRRSPEAGRWTRRSGRRPGAARLDGPSVAGRATWRCKAFSQNPKIDCGNFAASRSATTHFSRTSTCCARRASSGSQVETSRTWLTGSMPRICAPGEPTDYLGTRA